jgi:NADH-quinone oxidoreductase E subunit
VSGLETKEAESFAFTPENRAKADAEIAKYPDGRQASAVLSLLDLAQRQSGGWLPRAAIEHVASYLGMSFIRAYEVASFYSMLNLRPVGRHLVQLCRTTPCWLRGSDGVRDACQKALGIDVGETTPDGAFTLVEVECLGGCVNAPVAQINDDYYEDLTPEIMNEILFALMHGQPVTPGSQVGRQFGAPAGGLTTLKDAPEGETA